MRTGIVASVIANSTRDRKKRPEPFGVHDFMPFAERQDTDDDMSTKLKTALGHPDAKARTR